MTDDAKLLERDFGESTLTSKGQTTLPSELRQAFGLNAGDRLRWRRAPDGSLIAEPRKRRSILDIARENAFSIGEKGVDLDKLIDEAVSQAMADKLRRSTG